MEGFTQIVENNNKTFVIISKFNKNIFFRKFKKVLRKRKYVKNNNINLYNQ